MKKDRLQIYLSRFCLAGIILGLVKVGDIKKDKSDYIESISVNNNEFSINFDSAVRKGNDFVLMVSPMDDTFVSLYETIDLLKDNLENVKNNYIVLFNIDTLIDDNIYGNNNVLLAEEFCNKMATYGYNVGLLGTDSNMILFDERYREVTGTNTIDLYDKLIIAESSNILYDGTYTMTQNLLGDITTYVSTLDNDRSSVYDDLEDTEVIINDRDDLKNISYKFGMSEADIMTYNKIDITDLNSFSKISVPNSYNNDNDNINFSTEYDVGGMNRIVKGIDVSRCNGDINWESIVDVDYAMIKFGDFSMDSELNKNSYIDSKFVSNVRGCSNSNMPFGIYYVSNATDVDEARKEVLQVISDLEKYIPGMQIEYPIFVKFSNNVFLDVDKCMDIVLEVIKDFENEKYLAGIYIEDTLLTNNLKLFNTLNEKCNLWLSFEKENSKFNLVSGIDMYDYGNSINYMGAGSLLLGYAREQAHNEIIYDDYNWVNKPKKRSRTKGK